VIVARLVTPGQMLVVSLGLFTLVVIARHLWIRRAAPREARLKGRIQHA
jgi:hypothetical protein